MALETGIVKTVKGNSILVETEPNSGCSSCHAKASCMAGSADKKRSIWIKNTLKAEVGDPVTFRIEEKSVIYSSVLLYLFPVIMLIAGLIIGSSYHKVLDLDKDISSLSGGIIALVLSFLLIKFVSDRLKNKKTFLPVLTGIEKNSINK